MKVNSDNVLPKFRQHVYLTFCTSILNKIFKTVQKTMVQYKT